MSRQQHLPFGQFFSSSFSSLCFAQPLWLARQSVICAHLKHLQSGTPSVGLYSTVARITQERGVSWFWRNTPLCACTSVLLDLIQPQLRLRLLTKLARFGKAYKIPPAIFVYLITLLPVLGSRVFSYPIFAYASRSSLAPPVPNPFHDFPRNMAPLYAGFSIYIANQLAYRSVYAVLFEYIAFPIPKDRVLLRHAAIWATSIISVLISFPIDAVGRRIALQVNLPEPVYTDGFDCARKIWREEGFSGFYLGFAAVLADLTLNHFTSALYHTNFPPPPSPPAPRPELQKPAPQVSTDNNELPGTGSASATGEA